MTQLLARLPLGVLHALGRLLGWAVYGISPTYRRHVRENLAAAGYHEARLRRAAIAEAGKMFLEAPRVWLRPRADTLALLRGTDGLEHYDAARAAGKAIVLLTPHLGCFEICAQAFAERHPITVLYRPSKHEWLQPMIDRGRAQPGVSLASADLAGVRLLLAALKRRETVGILPGPGARRGRGRVGRVLRPPCLHHDARGEARGPRRRGVPAGGGRAPGARRRLRVAHPAAAAGAARGIGPAPRESRHRNHGAPASGAVPVGLQPLQDPRGCAAAAPGRERAASRTMTRLVVGILWLLHFLPLGALAAVGNTLGRLAFWLIPERRRVTRVNLEKCFPQMAPEARERLARAHFRAVTRSLVEHALLWWAPEARIRRLIRVEGLEHLTAPRAEPLILFVPHFVGLDACGTRLALECDAVAIYSAQKNAVFERLFAYGRGRFGNQRQVSRQEGVRTAIRSMVREKRPFFYLPDQDYGPRDALFVPFFGVQAATVPGLSRIARLGGCQSGALRHPHAARRRRLRGAARAAVGELPERRPPRRHQAHERIHRAAGARHARAVPVDAQALQDAAAGRGGVLLTRAPCCRRKRARD